MKNKNNRKKLGCIESYSSCIKWTGPNIPCLDICTGDEIDDVVFAIAEKVCLFVDGEDLSEISLQCVIEKFGIDEPSEITVKALLQILLTNDCTLYDLIKQLDEKIQDPNVKLQLDLKCLSQEDIFGSSISVTQLELDQLLINSVCSLKNEIATIKIKLIDLQEQIDGLDLTPYTEPLITSCLFVSTPVSQAVNLLASDYCVYKPKVGTISDISTAISRMPSEIATYFLLNSNFIQAPTSLAQDENNQWIAIFDLFNRVSAIEQTCCAPSCDKIKLGYTYSFDSDTETLTLTFTSGAGTVIPLGFTDCGTEFTFKDCSGNIILTSIQPIVSGGSLDFILPSGVCISNLSVSIKTKFCLRNANNDIILTCQDCLSKTIKITDDCCTLTNNGTEDVIITYSLITEA